MRTFFLFLYLALIGQTALAVKKINFNYTGESIDQSIFFVRLSDGKVLYQENPDLSLTPGSISKLFGAGAVLDHFGLNQRIQTNFYAGRSTSSKGSQMDLVVVGYGDPKLVSQDLWVIASDLKHSGVKKFSGDLVIDSSFFRDPGSHDRVETSSMGSSDTPLSALSVNFNTYEIAVSHGDKVGMKGKVSFYPYPIEGVPILNFLKTVSAKEKEKIQVRRVTRNGKDSIEVSGTIRLSSSLKKYNRSSSDALLLSGRTLKAFFKAHGIDIQGQIRSGRLVDYSEPKELLSYKGATVSSHLESFLAYSNNFMTDMFVNLLGSSAQKGNTFFQGMERIRNFVAQGSFPTKGFRIENASGLSKKNRVTARQMVIFLQMMARRHQDFHHFLAVLPRAGVEGSLKKRFQFKKAEPFMPLIRGKTGTLLTPVSVNSFAGYLLLPEGPVAFAVMQNGKIGQSPQANIVNLRHAVDLGVVQFLQSL